MFYNLLIMSDPKSKNFATILEEEVNNFETTASRYPEEMKYADIALILYEDVANHLQKYPKDLTPVLQMYWACFRGYLISSQLMFQAHIPEAYTIISRSAEAVAMARKMSLNNELILKWVTAKSKDNARPPHHLGTLFPKGDNVLHPEIYQIYKLTNNYGRHNNLGSTTFFTNLSKIKTENSVVFTYCDIDDEINLRECLNYQIYAYLKFLSAFREIFKKHLAKEWIKRFEQIESDYVAYKETLRDVIESK